MTITEILDASAKSKCFCFSWFIPDNQQHISITCVHICQKCLRWLANFKILNHLEFSQHVKTRLKNLGLPIPSWNSSQNTVLDSLCTNLCLTVYCGSCYPSYFVVVFGAQFWCRAVVFWSGVCIILFCEFVVKSTVWFLGWLHTQNQNCHSICKCVWDRR